MQKNTTSLWAGSTVAGLFVSRRHKPLPPFLAPHGALPSALMCMASAVMACACLSRSSFNIFIFLNLDFSYGQYFCQIRVGPRLRGRV